MAGVSINISLRGVKEVRNLLGRYARATGGRRGELHQRYGIQALNWINRNFQPQGGMLSDGPWAKLSSNTIAGRRKGSSNVLQDSGQLRQSFTMQFSDQQVAIGSGKEVALYHEKGTGLYGLRRASYPIYPKRAKALAFPVAQAMATGGRLKTVTAGGTTFKISLPRTVQVSQAMAMKSARSGSGKFKQGQTLILASSVIHPGVQIRRMLPTQTELMPQLLKTTIAFLKQLERKGESL